MEYIILGLLLLSPMTGYEIQRFIKTNLSLICSSSAGSVQTALKKLQQQGKITFTLEERAAKPKKIFAITPQGQEAFSQWVETPMQISKVKNMELSRLFFLGLASPAARRQAILDYIRQLQETQTTLTALRQVFVQAQSSPLPPDKNWPEIFRFQGYTLDYGIAAARFEENWYRDLLRQMEEEA